MVLQHRTVHPRRMNRLKNCIATECIATEAKAVRWLAALALLAASAPAWAGAVAGTVLQLTGAMSATQPGSAARSLALRAEVQSGDVLATSEGAYAMVKLIDNTELVLKPATTVALERFAFDHGRPADDGASLRLVKGGLRTVTGLLGKRNKEKFALHTPSATIGIRGTTFFLEYLTGQADGDAASPLAPGLHIYVSDGGVSLANQAGLFLYDPGQYGHIKDDVSKPLKMSANPGMRFDLPPAFGGSGLPIP
jgi:hypothetical protein